MHTLEALYLVEVQELMLGDGQCVKVPKQVADTVSPEHLDLRFVKNWATRCQILTAGADIGVVV